MKCNPRYVVATAVAAALVSMGASAAEPAAQKEKKLRSIPAHHTVVVRDAETGDMRAANAEELAALGLIKEEAPAALTSSVARSSLARSAVLVEEEAVGEEVAATNGVAMRVGQEFFSQLHATVDAEGKIVVSHDKDAKVAPAQKSAKKSEEK